MLETVKLSISPRVAQYVRPGTDASSKLAGLEACAQFSSSDRLMLAFCLSKDADLAVKEAAQAVFAGMPDEVPIDYTTTANPHPAVLDAIARSHHHKPAVVDALLKSHALSPPARAFLEGVAAAQAPTPVSEPFAEPLPRVELNADNADIEAHEGLEEPEELTEDEGPGEADSDGEEFLSKYKMAQIMGIAEKIKMALSGDKEWRSILIKDANKLVSGSVIKNPRITEAEILALLKSGVQNDEIMRLICANKEWVKNYQIRKALVDNPRTPPQNALRYLSTMGDKDLANYAKSKNVASLISTQAKRLILSKKK